MAQAELRGGDSLRLTLKVFPRLIIAEDVLLRYPVGLQRHQLPVINAVTAEVLN